MITKIEDETIHLQLDGRAAQTISFDAKAFQDFRHGYAGTIYKGQGRTLDQTYLYHSEHWRSAASYVALTRHRDKADVFVARNTAPDLKELARQMARVDNRKAASHYYQAGDGTSGKDASQVTNRGGREPTMDYVQLAKLSEGRKTLADDLAAIQSSETHGGDQTRRADEAPKTGSGVDSGRGRDRGGGRSL